jgi:LytS/YehU family sensor histidine kinase
VAITAAMTVMALIGSIVAIAALVVVGVVPPHNFGEWFRGSLRIAIVITLTIGLFITGYETMRAREAQAVTQAKLASLESRVQPHFLFNTLNSIAALIHEDPHGAERMTGQLASLMRTSLDQAAKPLVSLDDELKTVRDYLAIEQVRFGDRLRYRVDIDEAARQASVPRLSIQTLVENSVKYAVSPRRDGASIAIAVRVATADSRRFRTFVVTVEDDGPGFDAADIPSGHGLALLRDRVGLLFKRFPLRIESAPGRTVVTMTVPEFHDLPARPAARYDADAAK